MKNNKKYTLFITGIGGFVGRSLVEYFKKKPIQIIGLEIDPKKCQELEKQNVKIYNGSVLDSELIHKIFKENKIDYVYHTAAIVKEYGSYEDFYNINVQATEKIAKICLDHKVKVFIYLSSVMVYGFDYRFMVKEEDSIILKEKVMKTRNPYCVTKILAEEKLLELYDKNKQFPLIILRPGDIIGIHSVPWIVRPIDLYKKFIFSYPDYGAGILNLLYIQNLNEFIFHIIQSSKNNKNLKGKGQVFNICDEYITVKEFYNYLFKNLKIFKYYPFRLNKNIMKMFIYVLYYIYKIFGKEPLAHPEGVNFLLRNNPVDTTKIREVLNYKTKIRFYQAMEEIINYYNS